jgi:serine/threonine protein kinase
LHHPRIARLYDLFVDSLNYYILVEYCPRGALSGHIIASQRISEDRARVYFRDLLAAVQFMHRRGIAHRDIKPENILLDADGNVKLSDFGLSKSLGDERLTGTACGSPGYAAPELFSGRPYDPKKSDLWSCGVVLYVMVTGALPWTERHQIQLIRQIKRAAYMVPSWVSRKCADLVRSLMTVAPDERATVGRALESEWLRGIPQIREGFEEIPVVSLRKLDAFFERDEPGFVRPPVHRSRSMRMVGFKQEERRLRNTGATQGCEAEMTTIQSSLSLSTGGTVLNEQPEMETPIEETKGWRKRIRKKAQAPVCSLIVRPSVARPLSLDRLCGQANMIGV